MQTLCTCAGGRFRSVLPIICVGIAFLLVFAAFNTASQASESVLEGARREYGASFTASGYVSLAIVYASCAVANWISPIIVSSMKPKFGMFVGSLTYVFFLTTFFKPITWLIYFASAVMGVGAAVLWTAQGVYVTASSTEANVNRNFGIFWIIFQTSTLLGGIYTYFQLSNIESITSDSRIPMYGVFTGISSVGCLFFLTLMSPKPSKDGVDLNTEEAFNKDSIEEYTKSPVDLEVTRLPTQNAGSVAYLKSTIAQSFRLLEAPIMLAILVATCFTGLNLTFYSGVFGTCLSRMQVFGLAAKSYIGLSGIFIGLGEIIGGQVTSLSSTKIPPTIVMIIAFGIAFLSILLTFLMVPFEAPIRQTAASTYVYPSVYLAMFIALLLGLNDSLWSTQISALIGKVYPTSSDAVATAAAFALFKFVQSVTSAVAFAYSTVLYLQWQLLILLIFAILGIGGFMFALRRSISAKVVAESSFADGFDDA